MVEFLRIVIPINKIPDTIMINSFICVCLGALVSLIFAMIDLSDSFNSLCSKIFHKNSHDSVWKDVIDRKHGSNLNVYLYGKDYFIIGHYAFQDENISPDSWFAVSGFGKYDIKTKEPIGTTFHDDETIYTLIRLKDIERVEVF